MSSFAALEQAHRRLQHLYEISKLLASFESVEQTFEPALAIATRTLPLRSAILIEAGDGDSTMMIWPSVGHDVEEMRVAKAHVAAAYRYFAGVASSELRERAMAELPLTQGAEDPPARRFIVIPLVVARRAPFGALQLEAAKPLDKSDLMFVNAVANQLAVVLDRDRAWRRDITRRERAERGQNQAELRGATSERQRIIADVARERYEVLAAENERLYDEAQHAVALREQVLAIVSHDLRNPLGAIFMTAKTLLGRGEAVTGAGRILRAAERMQRLIEDLLDFASIEAGTLAMSREAQAAAPLIDEALASIEAVVHAKRLRMTVVVEPGLPKLSGDRDRILQVLGNLIGNATKIVAPEGHITVSVEARNGELVFTVADDGPGISAADAEHLFERYWRSGSAQYKGTGLGLAIARGIVSAHGGRIWLDSELGRGATFFFTIPVAQP
jgi:signal transduction histidine kinase